MTEPQCKKGPGINREHFLFNRSQSNVLNCGGEAQKFQMLWGTNPFTFVISRTRRAASHLCPRIISCLPIQPNIQEWECRIMAFS